MKHTLAIILLVLSLCAPGMAQTKPATDKSSTVTTATPAQPTTLQQVTIGDPPPLKTGHYTFTSETWPTSQLAPSNQVTWLTISKSESSVAWLIPTCTTANLKRAPKLTAWVVGMNAYSSPQARWLSALFKACEIQ